MSGGAFGLSVDSEKVRGWIRELLDSIVGEIGVSWTKFHAVIDDMEKFVKEAEAKFGPEPDSNPGGAF
jgi:hypothetical protein